MISETHKYIREGRSLIEKALDYEDFLLRRSLGLYYMAWGSAFVLFVIAGFIYSAYSSFSWSLPVIYVGVSLIAMFFTGYVFSRAAKASTLLKSVYRRSYHILDFSLFAIILAMVSISIIYDTYNYFVVFYIILSVYVPWVIFHIIKRSLSKVHFESWIAILSFAAACMASVAGIEKGLYLVLTLAWIIEAGVWFICGIISIFSAYYQSVVIEDDG